MIKVPSFRVIGVCIFASILASVSLGSYFGPDMQGTAEMLACLFLFLTAYALHPNRREIYFSALLGMGFAAFRVIGYSYDQLNSYGLIMKSAATMCSAVCAWLALSVASSCMIYILLVLVCRGMGGNAQSVIKRRDGGFLDLLLL